MSEIAVPYRDPVEGFAGYLTFDGRDHRLAAGGFRVQRGLTAGRVSDLARAMTLKQRVLGLAVDGATCGIDYGPRAPGKQKAMRRFLRFLRPYLLERLSMGPDMGTTWSEIEAAARAEDIPSVKIAVAAAQGLSPQDFQRRIRLLDVAVDGLTLAQRRAGHGLAHAAVGAIEWAGHRSRPARVGLQGFGTLGRAAALSVAQAGLRLTAVADEHGCLLCPAGLDVASLLSTAPGAPVARHGPAQSRTAPREALFEAPVDLLVLAACEEAMSPEQVGQLPSSAQTVVVGANLGLALAVEELLEQRGTVVVPDFVGGCGGPASMDALFGPSACPSPNEFLDRLSQRMRGLVKQVLDLAARHGICSRAAALVLCDERRPYPQGRPYGQWLP
ncbi:MAG TPA: Glu/Leu/Phe/Val dehydrogenase dimerization domain-containing protein [Egibacteraceae bacterium]|nr:Glu/Leu/Phe/Val dehydrogenase dimerization domain-containing protein [Egibacteraceae bacterium]